MMIGLTLMETSDSYRRGPRTPGEHLDAALREQEEKHQREIRELERKVESARRLALMKGDW